MCALARQEPHLLANAAEKVVKRLKDPQPIVISAALTAAIELYKSGHALSSRVASIVNALLPPSWDPNLDKSEYWFLLRVLSALRVFGPTAENLRLILQIIEWAANITPLPQSLLYQAFTVLSTRKPAVLAIVQSSPQSCPILPIRNLINSTDPDEQYLLLSCIECLDAAAWAGTIPEVPGVLDSWEVERIMTFLDSPDEAIRRKTLGILNAVDSNIVQGCYARILENIPDESFVDELNVAAQRALEVVEVLAGDDGAAYATRLQNAFAAFEGRGQNIVLEKAVEKVLTRFRTSEREFRVACLTVLLEPLQDATAKMGATSMVIVTALIVEHLPICPVPPGQLLQGLAGRLSSYPSSVKDACLVAMLRLSAECEVPPDVTERVRELSERSGRYIRQHCQQFISLNTQKEILQRAVAHSKTSSLPDFLISLEASIASSADSPTKPRTSSPRPTSPQDGRSSRASLSASKLRYDAYEPPRTQARLRAHRSASSSRSVGSSDLGSPRSERSALHDDPLSRTVTAGDLTLAAGDPELVRTAREQKHSVRAPQQVPDLLADAEISRSDLIILESPFSSEPVDLAASGAEPDFETIWNAMEPSNLRGWCDSSIDAVVRQFQTLQLAMRVIAADQAPFEGDLKIIISSEAGWSDNFKGAVMRLRESDDESCLWRLRCDDIELRTRLKRLLSQE